MLPFCWYEILAYATVLGLFVLFFSLAQLEGGKRVYIGRDFYAVTRPRSLVWCVSCSERGSATEIIILPYRRQDLDCDLVLGGA